MHYADSMSRLSRISGGIAYHTLEGNLHLTLTTYSIRRHPLLPIAITIRVQAVEDYGIPATSSSKNH
jgi:hypothetical protein